MTAYARLLRDALRGDQTLCARADSVEAAWELVDETLGQANNIVPVHDGILGSASRRADGRPNGGWHDPS